MRCPNCNKFVGQDTGDVDIQSLEIDGNEVTCEARLAIVCNDCGGELKEGNFQMSEEVPDGNIAAHQGEGHEMEVEEDGAEPIDEYETKDRRGKPIKNPRYQTHLYGVRVNFSVRCSCQENGAEALFSGALEDKMPASSFDECC